VLKATASKELRIGEKDIAPAPAALPAATPPTMFPSVWRVRPDNIEQRTKVKRKRANRTSEHQHEKKNEEPRHFHNMCTAPAQAPVPASPESLLSLLFARLLVMSAHIKHCS
jgi:hypothetical protein